MANAARMAVKFKAGSEKVKDKGGIGKGKSKKAEKVDVSSEHSELENGGDSDISSAKSSLVEPEVSQSKIKRRLTRL
jgi:hypothetical protein